MKNLNGKSRQIPAGEFKAKCLQIMDQVKEDHREVVITKHGKPVAKLVPFEEKIPDVFGFMKGTAKAVGDVMAPIDVKWEAND